jgi:hypothetical protein
LGIQVSSRVAYSTLVRRIGFYSSAKVADENPMIDGCRKIAISPTDFRNWHLGIVLRVEYPAQ